MTQHIHANGINIAYRIDGPAGGATGAADAPTLILSNSLLSGTEWCGMTLEATDKHR
jgi:hypothetical protein